jgi:tetratricopeptide (TPR) repeat protein
MDLRLERLMSLSLVTPMPGGQWVHRWTAEALAQSVPAQEQRDRCRRAGEFRLSRGAGQDIDYADGCEATHNFLDAADFDDASDLALQIANFHIERQQTIAAVAWASEVLQRLPNSAADWAPLADIEAQGSLQLGMTDRALVRTREIAEVFERRVQQAPGRADYQRNLAVSFEKLGVLMRALGQGEQEREFFEKSLAIWTRLAEAEPQRTDYQRGLCVPFERLGDLMSALGQGGKAREFFEKSLAIWTKLTDGEPGRADYQKGLCVPLDRLGDLMRSLGQGEQAREFFEKSLAIKKQLANAEPGWADYQRDLSVSFERLGDLMKALLGQGEQARGFFEKSLAIAQRLADAEPGRTDYQRDLSVSYDKLGDLMSDLGQGEQAREFFEKSLVIRQRLAEAEPGRADYQRDLCLSLARCAHCQGAQGVAMAAEAAALARQLRDSGRLSPADAGLIAYFDSLVETLRNS